MRVILARVKIPLILKNRTSGISWFVLFISIVAFAVADKLYAIMTAFAKTGLAAVIDEVTRKAMKQAKRELDN